MITHLVCRVVWLCSFRSFFCIGVTTKDLDSGPVPQGWGDVDSNDQYWYVLIGRNDCTGWHKGQYRELRCVLDRTAGNTFGCHMSETGELHLLHSGRDVGVACEGLPTDQPLWGFVVVNGYKVETNYVIAQSELEAVCVSVCMSSWPLRWKVFIYMTCIQLHTFHCVTIHFMSCQCQLLQPSQWVVLSCNVHGPFW